MPSHLSAAPAVGCCALLCLICLLLLQEIFDLTKSSLERLPYRMEASGAIPGKM